MRILLRILALLLWPLKMIGRGLSGLRPSRIRITVTAGRQAAAPWWRRAMRALTIAIGLGIYFGLQFGLGHLINADMYYQIMLMVVAVISLVLAVTKPAMAFAFWIVISPFGAVFFREAIMGRLMLSFDRVALSLLVIILALRALVHRHPPRKLSVGEWLLICSAAYINVVPLMGGRLPIIYIANTAMQLCVTPLAMYFIVKGAVKNKRQLYWLMLALYLMGMLWAASGFYEHFTGKSWMTPITQAGWGIDIELRRHDVAKGRAAGPTEHYYTYGEILALAVLLAYHFSNHTKKLAIKALSYASMGFMTVALYYGYSRAPFIAFAIAIFLMPLIASSGRKQYVALSLLFVLAVAAVSPLVLLNQDLTTRFLYGRGAFEARAVMNQSGINLIKKNFWLGVGVGKIRESLDPYISSPAHQRSRAGMYLAPHNDYLCVLGEQGIIGFILLYGAIIGLTRVAFRVRSSVPDAGVCGKDFIAVAIAFVLMHGITSMSDEFQSIPFSSYVLFTLLAMTTRLGELHEAEIEEAKQLPELPEHAVATASA